MQHKRYQRGSLFQRRGKFQVSWVFRFLDKERDSHGQEKKVHRSKVIGDARLIGKNEAQKLAAKLLAPLNEDTYTPTTVITFEEFYRQWKATKLEAFDRDSTKRFYHDTIHGWILPYFKDDHLVKIQPKHIQDFINRFKDKFARSTLKHIRSGLNEIFKTAVTWNYLTANPAARLRLPAGKLVVRATVFEAAQLYELYLNLNGRPKESQMVLVAAVTGVRESELFGLKAQDLDAEHCLIYIRQRVYKRREGPTKTPQSVRAIRVLPELFEALHYRHLQPTDFLFRGERGGAIRGDEIMKDHIRPVAEKLGLVGLSWRSFRRSAETTMHNNGVPLKAQQMVLGHANPNVAQEYATTMLYAEASKESLEKAAEVLGRPFFPKLEVVRAKTA